VRIFKIICAMTGLIYGQNMETFRLDSILQQYGEFGGRLVFINESKDFVLENDKKTVDEIFIKDGTIIRKQVIQKMFTPLKGAHSIPTAENILAAVRTSYPFIANRTQLHYGRLEDKKLGVLVDLESNFNSHFSGIAGVGKQDNESWGVAGELNIHLENAWQTATTTDLIWKKNEGASQYILFSHKDPYPFSLPFGTKVEFVQDLREDEYVHTITKGAFSVRLNNQGLWYFGGNREELSPTVVGDSMGISSFSSESISMEYIGDARNDRWLPTKGLFWHLQGEAGIATIIQKSLSYRFDLIFDKLFYLNEKFSLQTQFWNRAVWNEGNASVHEGQFIRYGGHNSLRGFQEDIFKSDFVSISNFNLLFVPSRMLHLYAFTDIAFDKKFDFKFSSGLGMRQKTKYSVMEISFGWPMEEAFSRGKVHVKFTSLLD